jgi:hypothetical protein
VSVVLNALVSQCGIANSSVTNTYTNGTLSPNGTVLAPRPEQMVQYYRASSFAVALSSYNNSAALPSNAPTSNSSAASPVSTDTPLPAGLNMTLLTCINNTVAASLPLIDTDSGKHGLTEEQIEWIAVSSIMGLFIIALLLKYCIGWCTRQRKQTCPLSGSQKPRRCPRIVLCLGRT